jgi:hypothetical protein
MALMNGARVGIAAQSMGIAEATYRIARDYAASRKQFGVAIENLPAVRDMVIDMSMRIEAGRALLYETCKVVDMEVNAQRRLAENPPTDKAEAKQLKVKSRKLKRYAAMLTPMSKYYCSEMCNKVAYDSIQVLGGSGYMRDYACERHARDARITTIYEGTSQLQVVAAVRGVCSGTAAKMLLDLDGLDYSSDAADLVEKLRAGTKLMAESIIAIKENGNEYMDLYGREVTDIAIDIIMGYLFLGQANSKLDMEVDVADEKSRISDEKVSMRERKAITARRFIERSAPKIRYLADIIKAGDKTTFTKYEVLVGPVPTQD